jgi:hypothetical protein
MPTTKAHEPPKSARPRSSRGNDARTAPTGQAYIVPMVHMSLPESAVNIGFWSILVGSVAFGAVDLPLAALIGAGVLIARHHHPH